MLSKKVSQKTYLFFVKKYRKVVGLDFMRRPGYWVSSRLAARYEIQQLNIGANPAFRLYLLTDTRRGLRFVLSLAPRSQAKT